MLTNSKQLNLNPHYLRDIITIQPSRSTRSSSLVTLLHPQAQSSLKITNRSFRYCQFRAMTIALTVSFKLVSFYH